MRHRNEAEFSRTLVRTLKQSGMRVVRLETGSTGQGVPDLYVISGLAGWVELKCQHCNARALMDGKRKVDYRPGQLAWQRTLSEYTWTHERVLTAVACDDAYVLIVKRDYLDPHVTDSDLAVQVQDLTTVSLCVQQFLSEGSEWR